MALYRAAQFRPTFAVGVVVLSLLAALFEGIGMGFILPIVELAQGQVDTANVSGVLAVFVSVYDTVGLPFTLGNLIVGVTAILTVRYTFTFLVGWLRAAIETYYIQHLQTRAFDSALDAEIAYFDREGSDDILNAIVTQSEYGGRVVRRTIEIVEQSLLSLMYLAIALFLAPVLTLVAAFTLGLIVVVFRNFLEAGYSLGDKVADANERIQEAAQAGTQGIRDVKLFGMGHELRSTFHEALTQFTGSRIKLARNRTAITSFYQLTTAVTIFVLIYVALTYSSLSLSSLGVFLFAIFRLGPRVSNLYSKLYQLEGELPHLVRTQRFIDDLDRSTEPKDGETVVPDPVESVAFDEVEFSYAGSQEAVLREISFAVERGEFVAFVGPSGAGKSTIVSMLARLYEPDSGAITANGISIHEFDVSAWRQHLSLVRQDPHIFNDTLRRNLTIGNRDADQADIDNVCEIAQITEFFDDLPNGYDTVLGDNGVRLSGGQRQRVAIARALLDDADLLILDEATSDLDTALEEQVHRGIEEVERDYAMIVVAHRLSTVINADRIYAMENGRIVEEGRHQELLQNDEMYAELYNVQT